MKKFSVILVFSFLGFALSSCMQKSEDNTDYEYPKSWRDKRTDEIGKIQEDGGLLDYFTDKSSSKSKGAVLGVNSYLWRASLDTVSFMPLASADPFGGVIITDWYENPEAPGERFKLNILILSTYMQADSVKVSVFKQLKNKSIWQDVKPSEKMSRELEDIILTRARQMKINNIS